MAAYNKVMVLSGTGATQTSPIVLTAIANWVAVSGPISSLNLKTQTRPATAQHTANGFTFSLISGANFTDGDTGAGGEYMGYAGAGLASSGLHPPKLGLEMDTFPNPGSGTVCSGDSRRDDEPTANHAALVYWGEKNHRFLSGHVDVKSEGRRRRVSAHRRRKPHQRQQ